MMLDEGGCRVLGPYRLGRKLGEGNFAKVHLAEDYLRKKVAIKVFNKQTINSMRHYTLKHVEREINALRVCTPHPHVANLLEVLETETDVFFVMEYVAGGELFDYIVSEGKLAEEESARIFYQIVSCVEYCHSRGIAHRDLKPENILLDTNMNVRIVDFGLASHQGQYLKSPTGFVEGDISEHKQIADEPTMLPPKMSTQCGSPEYAAPEVIRNDHGYEGAPVDVWSLGVVLYAMICGTLPFTAASIPQIVSNTLRGQFHIPSHVSTDASKLLKQMLCTNHKKRIILSEVLEHSWFEIRPEPHKKIEARPLMMVRALPNTKGGKVGSNEKEIEEVQRLVAVSVTENSNINTLGSLSLTESLGEKSGEKSENTQWIVDSLLPWDLKAGENSGRTRSTAVQPAKIATQKIGSSSRTGTTTNTTTTKKISTKKGKKLLAMVSSSPQLSQDERETRRDLKRKLLKAAEEGDIKTLKQLFKKDEVDLRWTGIDNWTVLHFAARKGHAEGVKVILKSLRPVDINAITKAGWTPLMMAADRGHTDVVNCLLTFGADIHLVSLSGKTAIFLSRESGHSHIAKKLTETSSQRTVESSTKDTGKRLQREFRNAAEDGDLNLMIYLLELAKKKQEKAKKKAKKNGVEYVLDPRNVVNINAVGMDNWTTLHYAARKGRIRVVQALIRSLKVDDINPRTKPGWTPLMLAAEKGHFGVCKLLLRYGAAVEVEDKEGNTASSLATNSGFVDLGKLLAKKTKKISSKDTGPKDTASKDTDPKEGGTD